MKRLIISCLTLLLLTAASFAQDSPKKRYKATRITTPPVINGILDDPAWKEGVWLDDFIQNEPYSGRPATQKTEFSILFDDNNLYVGIKAYDTSPDSIVNRLTRRDNNDGDIVGIILDSYHDLRTAFLFAVSSSGVKLDQVFTDDGQKQDQTWDPNWWVKTSINKEGWVAEMRIPFSQVRFEKNSGEVWGLEVARVYYRKNETDFWQIIPKDAPGLVHLFGELSGLDGIKPRKILDVTPYGVGKIETFKADYADPFKSKGRLSSLNAGVDAKIGVTNNMTMDLTINPDFGQVEADPSQVNLTAYETFFSEKRPFFIEGNNITNFGLGIGDGDVGNDNLFYSRRIGRSPQGSPDIKDNWYIDIPTRTTILGAAKLTGKTKDGLSIGFIDALTAEEKARIDTIGGRIRETVEPLTNYMVGRVQKDFNQGKTIVGGIFTGTNRMLDGYLTDVLHKAAYTGGLDFTQYFKNKNWMFNVNSAFSLVEGSRKAIEQTQKSSAHLFQRPDINYIRLDTNRTSLAGSGGRMQVMKLNGHWNFMFAGIWKSPQFEINDLGYLRQADQFLSVLWAQYYQFEPKGIYRNYRVNADVFSFWNFGGDYLGKGFEWNANMSLKNYWSVWTGGNIQPSSLSQDILRGGPLMKLPGSASFRMGINSDNRKKVVFNVNAFYNVSSQKYSNNLNVSGEIQYKPTNFLSFSFDPSYGTSFTQLQYVDQINFNNATKYIFASIDQKTISASFRINLNITPDLTLQYWGQPFIATGTYRDYKYIQSPMADAYKDRFKLYTPSQITYDADNNQYNIDENLDNVNDYSFARNDFNYKAFLSNFVIRWEYSPGSTVYLVWSQQRNEQVDSGTLHFFNDLGDLFNASRNKPYNVFLIKFSYRFGLK